MAGNQREMRNKEKKAQKDKRNKTVIWIIIIVVAAVLAVMKICEININTVKDYFTDSDGKISVTGSVSESNYPYNIDASQNVTVKNVNNKLGILTPSSFTVLDTKKASALYTFNHGYSNPVLKESGIYTLIYDQGSNTLRLDDTRENIYEHETENNIFCADVAKNGTIVYACTSDEKKCDIVVYSKALDKKLSVGISYGYVTAAAVNNSGSKIAFAAVTSKDAQLKTRLYTMDVGTGKVKAKIDLPSGNVIDLKYNSDKLYVVADSYVGIVSNQKSYKEVFESGKINTVCFAYTPSNELILAYNAYNNSTANKIVRIRGGGSVGREVSVTGTIRSISASSSDVSVLTDSNIITYRLGNMKQRSKQTVDDTVKSICRIGSTVFVHRQSLIDKSESDK